MGYLTDFSGSIVLQGLKEADLKKLKDVLHNHSFGISDEFQIETANEGIKLRICGSWKNYDEEMEKIIQAIIRAYPAIAKGWIDAAGEERDDTWALEIEKGRVRRIRFETVRGSEEILFDAHTEKRGGKTDA